MITAMQGQGREWGEDCQQFRHGELVGLLRELIGKAIDRHLEEAWRRGGPAAEEPLPDAADRQGGAQAQDRCRRAECLYNAIGMTDCYAP
jgi:hypothetical protein